MEKYWYAIEYARYEDVAEQNFPLTLKVHRFANKPDRDAVLTPRWRIATATERIVLHARFFRKRSGDPWPITLRLDSAHATPYVVE